MTNVSITKNGRCNLVIEIGTRLKVNNLPLYMVDEFEHRVVIARIKELISKRQAELDFGINTSKASIEAINELQYRFNSAINWPSGILAEQILAFQNEWLQLLPHNKGKSYRKLSQIAFDLILWAQQQLNPSQHEKL